MERVKRGVSKYCSRDSWKARFPITTWLPKYKAEFLVNDFVAGITVALTVLPQGLAYASIAKLEPQYGLYSAFMGCFIYIFLGMSKDITVGPTAIMSLLVAAYGKPIGHGSSDEELNDPRYAITLAFISGAIQIGLGILHLGALTSFISATVISGFTTASALTIGAGQIKHLLGISFEGDTFYQNIVGIITNIQYTNGWDLLLGSSALVVLIVLRLMKDISMKWESADTDASLCYVILYKTLWVIGTARNAVIVITFGLVAYTLEVTGHGDAISITGQIPAGLPDPKIPDFKLPDLVQVLETGMIIVPLIGFLEDIAIAKSFGRENGYKVEPNQELIALGSCNVAGSFFSSYPVTGSFSRTSINAQSGVKTQAGNLSTGLLVILSLMYMTPAFEYIPKAALAAVIISAVVNMMNFRIVLVLWKINKLDLLPLAGTFISALFLGVAYGTLIGICLDLMILLYPNARPQVKVETLHFPQSTTSGINVGQHRSYGSCENSSENHSVVAIPGDLETSTHEGSMQTKTGTVAVVHIMQGLFYPSAEFIQEKLYEITIDKKVEAAILNLNRMTNLDYSIVIALKDFVAEFQKSRCPIRENSEEQPIITNSNVLVAFTEMNETIETKLKLAAFGDAVVFCKDMDTALTCLSAAYTC